MDFEEFARRSASLDTSLIIPEKDFSGIGDAAEALDRIYVEHPETFWNVRGRSECDDDRLFVGLAIQAIKKQGNAKLLKAMPEIVAMMSESARMDDGIGACHA